MNAEKLERESEFLKECLRKLCDQRITFKSDYTNLGRNISDNNKNNNDLTPRYVQKEYFDDESSTIYKSGNMSLLTDMHPGRIDFSELIKGMSPIVVKDLEHVTGVYGETFEQMNNRFGTAKRKILNFSHSKNSSHHTSIDISNKTNSMNDTGVDLVKIGIKECSDKLNIDADCDRPASVPILPSDKIESVSDINHNSHKVNGNIEFENNGTIQKIDSNNDENLRKGGNVWIHYAMYVQDSDTPFDSSMRIVNSKSAKMCGNPLKVKADCNSLISGLAVAVRWLPIGSRGRFILPSSCMFGSSGCQQLGIKPGASILLLLHSLRFLDADAFHRYKNLDSESMRDFSIVSQLVVNVNAIGKDLFYRKNHIAATTMYSQSLEMLSGCPKTRENYEDYTALFNKTTVNLAICNQVTDRHHNAVACLDTIDNKSCEPPLKCKISFIRSKCLYHLGDLEESMRHIRYCLAMRPSNIDISKHHAIVHDAIYTADNLKKAIYKHSDIDPAFIKSCNDTKLAFIDLVKTLKQNRFNVRLIGGVSREDFCLLKTMMTDVTGWEFEVSGGMITFEKCSTH